MTTTTRTTLETDKVGGEPVADSAVEQQGKAMDEVALAPGGAIACGAIACGACTSTFSIACTRGLGTGSS